MAGLPCRIVVKGEAPERFASAFGGLSLRHHAGYTELRGTLADQCQLQSLLNRLFDLGIQLVSVSTGARCTDRGRSAGSGPHRALGPAD